MATSSLRRLRFTLAGGLALAALSIALPSVVSATPTPAAAPPTVASVTAQLTTISRQNEQLAEQLNLVTADIVAKKAAYTATEAKATALAQTYRTERAEMAQTLAVQYEGPSFSRTGALLNSNSEQSYMQTLTTINLLSVHRADMLSQVLSARKASEAASTQANALLAAAVARQASLKKQQASLEADQNKFEALLASLTAAQRTVYQSTGTVSMAQAQSITSAVHAGSSAAAKAVAFALAQVGKPYVYDASGPDSYDCSGLTMAAWASAGVQLPHNAEAQSHIGTPVAESALEPGDLVFFYQPIGHVTIYIGGGLMVSAPEPGEDVKVVTLASFQGDYSGATRLT